MRVFDRRRTFIPWEFRRGEWCWDGGARPWCAPLDAGLPSRTRPWSSECRWSLSPPIARTATNPVTRSTARIQQDQDIRAQSVRPSDTHTVCVHHVCRDIQCHAWADLEGGGWLGWLVTPLARQPISCYYYAREISNHAHVITHKRSKFILP